MDAERWFWSIFFSVGAGASHLQDFLEESRFRPKPALWLMGRLPVLVYMTLQAGVCLLFYWLAFNWVIREFAPASKLVGIATAIPNFSGPLVSTVLYLALTRWTVWSQFLPTGPIHWGSRFLSAPIRSVCSSALWEGIARHERALTDAAQEVLKSLAATAAQQRNVVARLGHETQKMLARREAHNLKNDLTIRLLAIETSEVSDVDYVAQVLALVAVHYGTKRRFLADLKRAADLVGDTPTPVAAEGVSLLSKIAIGYGIVLIGVLAAMKYSGPQTGTVRQFLPALFIPAFPLLIALARTRSSSAGRIVGAALVALPIVALTFSWSLGKEFSLPVRPVTLKDRRVPSRPLRDPFRTAEARIVDVPQLSIVEEDRKVHLLVHMKWLVHNPQQRVYRVVAYFVGDYEVLGVPRLTHNLELLDYSFTPHSGILPNFFAWMDVASFTRESCSTSSHLERWVERQLADLYDPG